MNRRHFLLLGTGATLAVALGGCDGVTRLLPGGGDPAGPFAGPSSPEIDAVSHVLNRLSWGPRPGEYDRVRALAGTAAEAAQAYIAEQLQPAAIADAPGFWAAGKFDAIDEPLGEHYEYDEKKLLDELVGATLLRAVESKRQLYEVMVGFWSDHFNIDPSKSDCRWTKASDDRDVIRAHAMGSFPALLRASALSPAMLWYLDGQANRKRGPQERPNENYARELLELHTLGVRGGYTQQDVMEAARCLTGWTVSGLKAFSTGKVSFVAENHDDGEKMVLGTRIPPGLGERDLDRLLEIVALHPSTADHLAAKLCRRFIADDPPPGAVATTARAFLKSGGDIPATLAALFASDDFLHARGGKFKLPMHFMVSALRATRADTGKAAPLAQFLQRMGHVPFHYPTPDGYPQEPWPWMGTLLWRWNFAAALSANRIDGTRLDVARLVADHSGKERALAHVLGRLPSETEAKGCFGSSQPLALALSSPAFQRY